MEEINRRFLDKFSNQWIKVKFYKDKPKLNGVKLVKKMRFCEATKLALIEPVMLNKKSISCVKFACNTAAADVHSPFSKGYDVPDLMGV